MTEQQQTLKNAIETQKNIISEINDLSNTINTKREFILKLQGVIEYLTSTGVTLPEEISQTPNTEI
jgi:peptidoglycan hydrolase CwlO-like protein